MKKCRLCGVEKDLQCFRFRNDRKKFRNECKECSQKINKIYYEKYGSRVRARANKYYVEHREKVLQYSKSIRQDQKNKGRFGGNKYLAFERDGYKCQKCGSTKNLLVHHIDGSGAEWSDKANNSLENLQTLCRSCHIGLHHRKYFGCLVPGCLKKHHAKGYCSGHQDRRPDGGWKKKKMERKREVVY